MREVTIQERLALKLLVVDLDGSGVLGNTVLRVVEEELVEVSGVDFDVGRWVGR